MVTSKDIDILLYVPAVTGGRVLERRCDTAALRIWRYLGCEGWDRADDKAAQPVRSRRMTTATPCWPVSRAARTPARRRYRPRSVAASSGAATC